MEQPTYAPHRDWDDLPDGGMLITSADGWLRLRRVDADGTTRWEVRSGDGYQINASAAVRHDGSGGAYFMNDCAVSRIDATGTTLWRRSLAGESNQDCGQSMEVLSDGSLWVLRNKGVMRIAPDGTDRWNVAAWPTTRSLKPQWSSMAPDGTTWIALGDEFYVEGPPAVITYRYDLDGNRLASDQYSCDNCIETYVTGIAALPDGGAIVAGRGSMTDSVDAFVVRLDGVGNHVVLSRGPAAPMESVVVDTDQAGHVYLSGEAGTRAIDPNTGNVLWTVTSGVVLPLSNGIIVANKVNSYPDVAVRAYTAAGDLRWTRLVRSSDSGGVGAPKLTSLGPSFRVDDGYNPLGPCGISPRVITFSDAGSPVRDVHACAAQNPTAAVGIDARTGVGMLERADTLLTMRAPDGTRRWSVDLCAWCVRELEYATTYVDNAVLRADGGAWFVTRPDFYYGVPVTTDDRVERVDASGAIVASAAMVDVPGNRVSVAQLVDGPNEVFVVMYGQIGTSLYWKRVSNAGAILGTGSFATCANSCTVLKAVRRADGGVNLLLSATHVGSTFVYTVVQLAANGVELRRYASDAAWGKSAATMGDDGTLYVVSVGAQTVYRKFAPNGSVSAPVELPPLDFYWFDRGVLSGPVNGKLLLTGNYMSVNQSVAIRSDNGMVTATRVATLRLLDATPYGYLVRIPPDAAQLVDPTTLATIHRFDNGTDYPIITTNYASFWKGVDDGSIYMTDTVTTLEPMRRVRTQRFAIPGTPSDDAIFRDGFN